MSTGNLRNKLPEINTIIDSGDKVIIETAARGTVAAEFGTIIFDKDNFEIGNTLDDNIILTQQISGDIDSYVNERLNIVTSPEILCLYYKEFTNSTGVVVGQQDIATTDLSLNFFQVSTIKPADIETLEVSQDKSITEGAMSSNGINLTTGIYKVECIGSFTQSGPAGMFLPSGQILGNGDRGYLVLELFKETLPSQSLLVSTPIITYSPEITITSAPSSWCGTQSEWEEYQNSNYEIDSTHTAYMYGYISICQPSNIRFKIHTAGSYIIGYPNPDNDTDLPPTLYNPIQLIFEKISNDPFEFNIDGPESKYISAPPIIREVVEIEAAQGAPAAPPAPLLNTDAPTITAVPAVRLPAGERTFEKPGVYRWQVPDNVNTISVVAVGAGGGGAATNDRTPNGGNGGDLRWRNNINVTPNSTLVIRVGQGGTSFRSNIDNIDSDGTDGKETEIEYTGKTILRAAGGRGGRGYNTPQPANRGSTNLDLSNVGGGDGGRGGRGAVPEEATAGGGGGGAGGYTSNGGDGGNYNQNGKDSKSGGGGGGSGGKGTGTAGGGGGGVGLFGKGVDGEGGLLPDTRANGKSGKTGSRNLHKGIDLTEKTSFGFNYGGGGGGKGEFMGATIGRNVSNQHGGNGAVRIIWGSGREFPNNAK